MGSAQASRLVEAQEEWDLLSSLQLSTSFVSNLFHSLAPYKSFVVSSKSLAPESEQLAIVHFSLVGVPELAHK